MDTASILDESVLSNKPRTQLDMKTTGNMIYTFFLYFCMLSGIGMSGYAVYKLAYYGFENPDDQVQVDLDGSRIVTIFMTFSQVLVFFIGIRARMTLDDREQQRFTIFLRVLTELYAFLLIFFGLCYLEFRYLSDDSPLIQILDIAFCGSHMIIFFFMFFRASSLAKTLNRIYKEKLKDLREQKKGEP